MSEIRHVGKEIRNLSNKIKRTIDEAGNKFEPNDSSAIQSWIMGYLALNGDKAIYQKDIEREFRIRRSTATGILKNMERNGYITRVAVEHDARLKKLVLSPKALALHDVIQTNIDEMERRLTKGLTSQEIDLFFDIVRRMNENLE